MDCANAGAVSVGDKDRRTIAIPFDGRCRYAPMADGVIEVVEPGDKIDSKIGDGGAGTH